MYYLFQLAYLAIFPVVGFAITYYFVHRDIDHKQALERLKPWFAGLGIFIGVMAFVALLWTMTHTEVIGLAPWMSVCIITTLLCAMFFALTGVVTLLSPLLPLVQARRCRLVLDRLRPVQAIVGLVMFSSLVLTVVVSFIEFGDQLMANLRFVCAL